SMQWAIASGPHSILTPSAASTSAEPEREEIERLPCLATGTPAPATTNAVQVEMLCVPLASPPVPQVSMAPSGARTVTACDALQAKVYAAFLNLPSANTIPSGCTETLLSGHGQQPLGQCRPVPRQTRLHNCPEGSPG